MIKLCLLILAAIFALHRPAFGFSGWGQYTIVFSGDIISTEGQVSLNVDILPNTSLYSRLGYTSDARLNLYGAINIGLSPWRFSLAADFLDTFRKASVTATYWRSPWHLQTQFSISATDPPSLEFSWFYEESFSVWTEGTYRLTGYWQDWKLGFESTIFVGCRWRAVVDFFEEDDAVVLKQRLKLDTHLGQFVCDFLNFKLTEFGWSREIEANSISHRIDVLVTWEENVRLNFSVEQETETNGIGLYAETSLFPPWEFQKCSLAVWGLGWKIQLDLLNQVIKLRVSQRLGKDLKVGCDVEWAEKIKGEAWITATIYSLALTFGIRLEESGLGSYVTVYWEW